MTEQTEMDAQLTEVTEIPNQKISFKDYKQKLKNEVEIAELRARIANAYFQELAAGNQYNQLRAQLSAQSAEGKELIEKLKTVQASETAVSTEVNTAQPSVED